MKIVISPAKSLEMEREIPVSRHTLPEFIDKAAALNKILAKKSPKSLSKLMGISSDLAELNYTRNQEFEVPLKPENSRQAVYMFNGDVYQGLDVYSLPESKVEQMQQSLRILSGLYGILKPLDLIQPYRLEMGTNMKVGRKKNLYEYWKKDITDFLNDELEEDELFINLASKEYFSAIDSKKLKVPVITPVFKDWKNDKLRVISFFAKQARGSMVKYILEENVQDIAGLKGFNYMDYTFSQEHTVKANEPVFVR